MSNLNLRRLFVVILSQALGFGAAYLLITVGFNLIAAVTPIEGNQARTIAEYGPLYFLVTFFPLGIIFMIWLDKFMDTRILPD